MKQNSCTEAVRKQRYRGEHNGSREDITSNRKREQPREGKRYQIEALNRAGKNAAEIAGQLKCSKRAIEREMKRGTVQQLRSKYKYVRRYCADAGQRVHAQRTVNKGRTLKIGYDHSLIKAVKELIMDEHYSPDAALARYRIETGYRGSICAKTLYNYTAWVLLAGVAPENLPRKRHNNPRKARHRRVSLTNIHGRRIEEPSEINLRIEEGHWDGDTVVGRQGTNSCLFVLTERKKNPELLFKLKSKSQACVAEVLTVWKEYGEAKGLGRSFKA